MNTNFLKIGFAVVLAAVAFTACDKDDKDGDKDRMELYVTNNTDGNVTVYDLESDEMRTLTTTATAAEGIYYDSDNDRIIQASRSANQLDVFSDVKEAANNVALATLFSSSADLSSPRDVAVNGNIVVVADNADADGNTATADGKLFVYTKTDGAFTLRNTITTEFAVWGIEFVGDNLYAIVDKTNQLAVFNNFAAGNMIDATVSATKTIMIEGIVRTHGLAYDAGTMILTDIGDANSDSDGAFHIIADFDSKFNGVSNAGMLTLADQVRVAGAATNLGNPVSAEYDADSKTIYIAEAKKDGGRVLSFTDASAGGDLTPKMNKTLAGASSLYLYMEK